METFFSTFILCQLCRRQGRLDGEDVFRQRDQTPARSTVQLLGQPRAQVLLQVRVRQVGPVTVWLILLFQLVNL